MSKHNVIWHHAIVFHSDREAMNRHREAAIRFAGPSGIGKSTVAHAVERKLHRVRCRTSVFKGDNVRLVSSSDLDFAFEDRIEKLRRIGEMVKLFVKAGMIALTAFILPLKKDCERVRLLLPHKDFLDFFSDASIETRGSRDVKDLYRRTREGGISELTEIASAYEMSVNPDLILSAGKRSLEAFVGEVLELLQTRDIAGGEPAMS